MPTVIDSLILEIGLDPSKFTKGLDKSAKDADKWKEHVSKVADDVEKAGTRSAQFLGLVQTKLLAVGALFASIGVAKFATEISKQDAATGRLSYTLGTSAKELDKWRNAAYLAGGSSEGITTFIQGLTSEFAKFSITGESSLIPYFRGLGVQVADANGKMRPFADIIHDVSNAVQKLGPQQGAEWLRSIGADQGTINLMIHGGDAMDRYLKLGEQFSTVNAQGTENALKLTLAINSLELALTGLGRSVLNYFSTGLIEKFGRLSGYLLDLSQSSGPLDAVQRYAGLITGSRTPQVPGGGVPSKEERLAFYRAEAAKRGISPDVVESIVRSEGLDKYVGDQGTSFGDFQLHYKNNIPGLSLGGLGDVFTKQTGLDARDPSTWKQQATFSLDQMKSGGLSPWHGWKGAQWAGIDRGSKSEVHIDNINIQTQATDATGVANAIVPAINRASDTYHSQGGPQ